MRVRLGWLLGLVLVVLCGEQWRSGRGSAVAGARADAEQDDDCVRLWRLFVERAAGRRRSAAIDDRGPRRRCRFFRRMGSGLRLPGSTTAIPMCM